MNIPDTIRAVQRALKLDPDGIAGPQTWAAIHRRIVGIAPLPSAGEVDARSASVIATLLPEVRPYARALIHEAAAAEITLKVISGTRTYAEQDALYAQGRTAPGPKVTNARGGYSNHNHGIAFDVGVFSGDRYVPESSAYKAAGAIGRRLGLEWGGTWTSIVDEPHFQLRPTWAAGMSERDMLAELRARKSMGKPVF